MKSKSLTKGLDKVLSKVELSTITSFDRLKDAFKFRRSQPKEYQLALRIYTFWGETQRAIKKCKEKIEKLHSDWIV